MKLIIACILFVATLAVQIERKKTEYNDLVKYSSKIDVDVELKRNITAWKGMKYGWVRTCPHYATWKRYIYKKYGFHIECDNDVVYKYFKTWLKNNCSFNTLKKYKWFFNKRVGGEWCHDDLADFSKSLSDIKKYRKTDSKLIIGAAV